MIAYTDEQVRERMEGDPDDFALEQLSSGPGVPVAFSRSDGKVYMAMERDEAFAAALRAYLIRNGAPILRTNADRASWLSAMRQRHGFG